MMELSKKQERKRMALKRLRDKNMIQASDSIAYMYAEVLKVKIPDNLLASISDGARARMLKDADRLVQAELKIMQEEGSDDEEEAVA